MLPAGQTSGLPTSRHGRAMVAMVIGRRIRAHRVRRGSRFAIQQGDRLPVVDYPAMQQQEQPAQPVVSLADFQTSDEESGESSGDEAPSLGPAEEFVLGTRRAFSMS